MGRISKQTSNVRRIIQLHSSTNQMPSNGATCSLDPPNILCCKGSCHQRNDKNAEIKSLKTKVKSGKHVENDGTDALWQCTYMHFPQGSFFLVGQPSAKPLWIIPGSTTIDSRVWLQCNLDMPRGQEEMPEQNGLDLHRLATTMTLDEGGQLKSAPKSLSQFVFFRAAKSGQITIIPKPELRGSGETSLSKPPFGVNSAEVAIICSGKMT